MTWRHGNTSKDCLLWGNPPVNCALPSVGVPSRMQWWGLWWFCSLSCLWYRMYSILRRNNESVIFRERFTKNLVSYPRVPFWSFYGTRRMKYCSVNTWTDYVTMYAVISRWHQLLLWTANSCLLGCILILTFTLERNEYHCRYSTWLFSHQRWSMECTLLPK